MNKEKIKNELEMARRSRGLSRKQVSKLIGYKGTSALSAYERGVSVPPLRTLLALEIIYRRPVAFLYSHLYNGLREMIRAKEEEILGEEAHA